VKQLGTCVTIVIGVLLGLVSMSNAQDVDEAILQQKVTIKPNSPGYPKRNNFPHRWYNVKTHRQQNLPDRPDGGRCD
jgi:hypothetical protein